MINDKIYIEYVRVLVMEEKPNVEAVANTEKKEVVTEKTKKNKKDLIINLVLIFFMLMIFIAIVIPLIKDTFTATSRDTFIANLQEIVRTAVEKYDASSRDEIIFISSQETFLILGFFGLSVERSFCILSLQNLSLRDFCCSLVNSMLIVNC